MPINYNSNNIEFLKLAIDELTIIRDSIAIIGNSKAVPADFYVDVWKELSNIPINKWIEIYSNAIENASIPQWVYNKNNSYCSTVFGGHIFRIDFMKFSEKWVLLCDGTIVDYFDTALAAKKYVVEFVTNKTKKLIG